MSDLHGCTHGWEEGRDAIIVECPTCQIARLTRERDIALLGQQNLQTALAKLESEYDELATANARHLALLIQQRVKTRSIAEAADAWLKQRDDAREAVSRILAYPPRGPQQYSTLIACYPWIADDA